MPTEHWSHLFARGVAAQREGDTAGACALYRAAADLTADPAPPRLLALLLAESGDVASGLAWGRRAIARDAASAHSHAALGRILLQARAWSEASAAFRDAIAFDPSMAMAHYGLGQARMALGDAGAACDALAAALRLRPGDVRAQRAYAAALVQAADPDRAVTGSAQFADAGDIQHTCGQVLFRAGRAAAAADVLSRAARLLPDLAAVHHDLGTALHEARRLEDAVDAYRTALRLDPGRVETWHNFGSVLQAMGDMDGAMRGYACAYAIDPASMPRIAQELAAGNPGRVYLRAEDLRRALAELIQ